MVFVSQGAAFGPVGALSPIGAVRVCVSGSSCSLWGWVGFGAGVGIVDYRFQWGMVVGRPCWRILAFWPATWAALFRVGGHGLCLRVYGLETCVTHRESSHSPLAPIWAGRVCVLGRCLSLRRWVGLGNRVELVNYMVLWGMLLDRLVCRSLACLPETRAAMDGVEGMDCALGSSA